MQSKKSGHVPSTAKASRELKNTSKGNALEVELGQKLHHFGTPVLISPKYFRSLNLGQVDICIFYENQLHLFEVKHQVVFLSTRQHLRLLKSLDHLIYIFDSPGKFHIINSLPKHFSFLNLNT